MSHDMKLNIFYYFQYALFENCFFGALLNIAKKGPKTKNCGKIGKNHLSTLYYFIFHHNIRLSTIPSLNVSTRTTHQCGKICNM